jgi:hypothetical protein
MRTILKPRTLGTLWGLLLLCSCATTPQPSAIVPASDLPADVMMNKEAGRGGWLFATVRLESGEELPFLVDTGALITLFDKSLEPKLGKRLGSFQNESVLGKQETGIYAAPKLYLGNTPLMMTGTNIFTCDLKQISSALGHPVMGILGVEVLEHYCIQLDFKAGKMRFLDPNHLNVAELGRAFPVIFSSEGQSHWDRVNPFIHHSSLIGVNDTLLLIDTGFSGDSTMKPELFRRQVQQQSGDTPAEKTALFRECVWDGRTYTNLKIEAWPVRSHSQKPNLLGLRFLARHLVTLDFPGRTMYLKQTSIGPLVDEVEERYSAP